MTPDLLKPLVGLLGWQPQRSIGSCFLFEFGAPYLRVREPIEPRASTSPKVVRDLRRRRVFVKGDWGLLVDTGAEWRLETKNFTLGWEAEWTTPDEEAMRDLDGQRVVSIEPGQGAGS